MLPVVELRRRQPFSDLRDSLMPQWTEHSTHPVHPRFEPEENHDAAMYMDAVQQFFERRTDWMPRDDERLAFGYIGFNDDNRSFSRALDHPSANRQIICVTVQRHFRHPGSAWTEVYHGTSPGSPYALSLSLIHI